MSTPVIELAVPEQLDFPSEYFTNATEDHFWVKGRTARFLKMFHRSQFAAQTQKRIHVFEIGCGNGVVRRQLEHRYTDWTVDGCDLDLPGLNRQGAVRGKTYFYDITRQEPSLQGAYSGVLLFDVLEHIEHPVDFLRSVAWHLKPGGWLGLNVPALPKLYSKYDSVQGHVKRYTTTALKAELEASDFQLHDLAYWAWSMVPVAQIRKRQVDRMEDTEAILRAGFRPPGALVNAALGTVLRLERAVLSQPAAGTSAMALAQKPL